MQRRHFLHALGATALSCTLPCFILPAHAASAWEEDQLRNLIEALEVQAGGRLGISLHRFGQGEIFSHRSSERFPLCSTFKVLLAGAVLYKSQNEQTLLDRAIPVRQKDLLAHSPVMAQYVGKSCSVADICAAALTQSDNAAANLLLEVLGGPEALRSFTWSQLEDTTFRLDRREPELNDVSPGDLRDSTSPTAMAASLGTLVLGQKVLQERQRAQLIQWLKATQTGKARIRRGAPEGWEVGNRSGTGPYGITNDVAVLWPNEGAPFILALYYIQENTTAKTNEALLAQVAGMLCRYRW